MAGRHHASLALAVIVVVARLLGSSGTASARATTTEESVRAEIGHHHAPSRKVRSLHGAQARLAARNQALGACLESLPFVVEDPPRSLIPPPVLVPAALVEELPPPIAQARAPPR